MKNELLIENILNGEHDSIMDDLTTAIKERRKLIRTSATASNMISISVGDRVSLKNLRPKKVNGLEGVVISKQRTKMTIDLDSPDYAMVDVPADCVNVIAR